jgi:hypothetical protein
MKINTVDLDNKIVSWQLTGHISKGRMQNKSSLHLLARKTITIKFPTLQILEEVPIPIRKSETLYLDFYLPLIKTCIEVHGEQHYKFIGFYHNNIAGFLKAKKRDQDKEEWCSKNNITHIVLPFSESEQEWRNRLDDKNS